MYEISKEFRFSASHSVYSQSLKKGWATNLYPKCRRLPGHGHNYRLEVFLRSKELDASQMVTDFGHLGWLKAFIDRCFDHKLILGFDDPALGLFLGKLGFLHGDTLGVEGCSFEVDAVDENYNYIRYERVEHVKLHDARLMKFITFNGSNCKGIPEFDFYQRFIDGIALFSGSPTSENLSRFFFYLVSRKVKGLGIECSRISISESDTSSAEYYEEG